MACTAAMKAVLGTAELLEDILITAVFQGMTHKELLLAQRVSTNWKATIEGSPQLQKLLGFRPATNHQDLEFLRQWSAKRALLGDDLEDHRGIQSVERDDLDIDFRVFTNPLVENVLEDELPDFSIADSTVFRDSRDICSDEDLQNYKSHRARSKTYIDKRVRRQDQDKHHFFADGPQRERYERWSQTNTSMRRMLLSQPPPVSVNLVFVGKKGTYVTKAVKNFDGVTLGDVWRAGMEVDVPYDTKGDCEVNYEYSFDPDVVEKLVQFWAKTGEYSCDSDYDTEEDSELSDDTNDSEEDWEDYDEAEWWSLWSGDDDTDREESEDECDEEDEDVNDD